MKSQPHPQNLKQQSGRIQTYREFWPFYLAEHKNPTNRYLHFVGSTIGIFLLVLSAVRHSGWFVLLAFLTGYAFAWFGHFVIEKNRPATFKYPLWSFISDWRMWYMMLTRQKLWSSEQANPK